MQENQLQMFDQLIRDKRFGELKLLVAYLKEQQAQEALEKQQAAEKARTKPLETLIKSFPEERQKSLDALSEIVARHGHAMSERDTHTY